MFNIPQGVHGIGNYYRKTPNEIFQLTTIPDARFGQIKVVLMRITGFGWWSNCVTPIDMYNLTANEWSIVTGGDPALFERVEVVFENPQQ